MRLEGIHHVTAITGDAPANVDFYAGVLGLRLVKKTVNQDDPTVYHLFYADERGSAGADITFFEYPGAPPRARGRRDGAPRRLARRLGGGARLLGRAARRRGRRARATGACASPIPRGSRSSCVVDRDGDEPLVAEHPEIPRGARARAASTACARTRASRSRAATRSSRRARLRARGAAGRSAASSRGGFYATTPPPEARRPRRGHRAPRRLGLDARRSTRRGASGSRRRARARRR